MILLLCLLLGPALKGYEQPRKYWYFVPVTLLAWFIDVWVRYTTWRVIGGPLRKGEWTISQNLERLVREPGPRQQLFIEIAREINRHAPSKKHIPLP